MKYMLLVHHDEAVFAKLSEVKQKQMLEESVQLTHKLHADGQYLSASGGEAARPAPQQRAGYRYSPDPEYSRSIRSAGDGP